MKTLKLLVLFCCFISTTVVADEYIIDKKGMHAFIQFRISHLGYSWLYGRFNQFEGEFSYDKANPDASKIAVTIETGSVDSNHAERDKHLRSDDFLYVDKYPEASFVSTSFMLNDDNTGLMKGDFTLRGVTRPITIELKKVGEGDDPWGGYRVGFEGTTRFALADYGIPKDLGPATRDVELTLSIEGVRK